MRLAYSLLLVFVVVWVAPVESAAATWEFSPTADVRIRQEVLDGVLYFAPDSQRNWVRLRSRAGFQLSGSDHQFVVRLANEHRHILHPDDAEFSWDELVVDQASWLWKPNDVTRLTLGRQNVIWDKGFLMLEGHPLDGSRSIYQNALRVLHDHSWGQSELILIHNPKYDPIVLIDDQHKALCDTDETAVALRLDFGRQNISLIWKNEIDPDGVLPDLQTATLATRWEGTVGQETKLMAEVALQYQDGATWQAYGDDAVKGTAGSTDGFAFAAQASAARGIGGKIQAEAELFYYSGGNDNLLPFRAPWGKWPKWSELYIYTLIGESEPGRVHVAAWENIAAPRFTLRRPLWDGASVRSTFSYLLAPEPDWTARGLLLATELKFKLPGQIKGHLLWEMLEPGDFHDGRYGYRPMTETVHFLRWQLSYAFN